jgi:hypothetical protein
MSSPVQLRLAALAAILALTGACSDSTGPSDVQPADLSQVLAELQPSSLAPLAGQVSGVPVAALAAPVPSSCSYESASKSFVCPNVSVSNITVSRSFTLLDASGAPQTAFDKTTTAAVRMKTAFAGTVTSPTTTMVIEQQQDITLSGLLTGAHTLNGTSSGRLTGSVGAGTTTIPVATTISTTITNVVLPRSSSGSQWPQSGTITATITDSALAGMPEATSTVIITFNGTSRPTISITVNGVTLTSTIDLANPGSVRG